MKIVIRDAVQALYMQCRNSVCPSISPARHICVLSND